MKNYISPFSIDKNNVKKFKLTNESTDIQNTIININIGADYEISEVVHKSDMYTAELDLKLLVDGKQEDKPIFSLELVMTGTFSAKSEEVEIDKFMKMLEINGLTTLMQLSRAYITTVTALSGFGRPINFPMVNILKLVEMKNRDLAQKSGAKEKK